MRRKRRRIQYYSGETTRERLRDKVWLPFAIVAAAALILALIVGAILGGIAEDSRLSAGVRKDLADFGGVEAPEKKYKDIISIQADAVAMDGMDADDFRDAISDLPEGNAVGFLLYDGAGGVFFDAVLAQKGGVSLNIKASLSAAEIADTARAKGRYGVGLFVTGAFRESDEQLRILKISEEIALLSELAEAGIREIVIVGFPTDSDDVAAVNSYMRQASEVCGNVMLGVAISSEDAVSSGISRLVACTEVYADSYFLDFRDVAESQLASVIEKNAYFLTAYNMRLMLSGVERETLLSCAASYGVQNYLIEE